MTFNWCFTEFKSHPPDANRALWLAYNITNHWSVWEIVVQPSGRTFQQVPLKQPSHAFFFFSSLHQRRNRTRVRKHDVTVVSKPLSPYSNSSRPQSFDLHWICRQTSCTKFLVPIVRGAKLEKGRAFNTRKIQIVSLLRINRNNRE